MEAARKHKRYTLDDRDVTGRLLLTSFVEIIDISIGGIALKVNRILKTGSGYNLKLEDRRGFLSLRGVVVRSSLSETRKVQNGDVIPIYTIGLRFANISAEKADELLAFIERHKKEARVAGSNRLNVRFHITVSENEMLHCPDSYRVKQISLSSMLIECVQALEIKSRIQMELSLYEDEIDMFEGMVVSCTSKESYRQDQYVIGIEFLNLTDKNRQILNAFIDYRAVEKDRSEAENKTSGKAKSSMSEELKDNVEYLYNWHKTLGFYKLLGIQEYANSENIKRAYYAMARKFHQDMHPDIPNDLRDKMNVIFTYVNTAYVTLSDPQKRQAYDKTLLRKEKTVEV